MEACATAHHWARELAALGHDVRLMPPTYMKAYVRRYKNDVADAEAISEAVIRPTMDTPTPCRRLERSVELGDQSADDIGASSNTSLHQQAEHDRPRPSQPPSPWAPSTQDKLGLDCLHRPSRWAT
jgi:transposase